MFLCVAVAVYFSAFARFSTVCGAMPGDRSLSRRSWRGSVCRFQPAAARGDVQWLTIEDECSGLWRKVSDTMAVRLEEQWQSNAELDLLEEHSDFPPFRRFYTHVMLNMAPVMSQGTFEDRERTRWIDRRRLVRVIVQTGRRDA